MSSLPEDPAPGVSSCIRLRQRRKVDLPQPEGPMTASTLRSGTARLTSLNTVAEPNQAWSFSTTILGAFDIRGASVRATGRGGRRAWASGLGAGRFTLHLGGGFAPG